MDFDLFKKVVDECAALGITHVRVHNYGEPFLDKQLVEKVRYAKQRGIAEVGMISNGSLITEEIARGMIDAGLDAINISVDAVRQGDVRDARASTSTTTTSSATSRRCCALREASRHAGGRS